MRKECTLFIPDQLNITLIDEYSKIVFIRRIIENCIEGNCFILYVSALFCLKYT